MLFSKLHGEIELGLSFILLHGEISGHKKPDLRIFPLLKSQRGRRIVASSAPRKTSFLIFQYITASFIKVKRRTRYIS